MITLFFHGGTIVLENGLLVDGRVEVNDGQITAVRASPSAPSTEEPDLKSARTVQSVDLQGGYLVPGYVDLHVHGGGGADFMDGTEAAFQKICTAHAQHGTTSLLPTTTVARHEQHLAFLDLCRRFRREGTQSARIVGAHFYGPYFRAKHAAAIRRLPCARPWRRNTRIISPTLTALRPPRSPRSSPGPRPLSVPAGQREFAATPAILSPRSKQMEAAVAWGIRHVDHLFCAMSDRARLRQSQSYPMRGGVMEATLFFDELTTEVIADGKHLQRELLLLAYKINGPDRLALVTDCNRALDLPDGEYIFGPSDGGEPFLRRDGVGVMPDGNALASGVMGMDHAVRTFYQMTGVPLFEVVRMACLTPARIN